MEFSHLHKNKVKTYKFRTYILTVNISGDWDEEFFIFSLYTSILFIFYIVCHLWDLREGFCVYVSGDPAGLTQDHVPESLACLDTDKRA